MSKLLHVPPTADYPTPPISSAVCAGDLVFVSGTPGFNPDGTLEAIFAGQFARAVEELARVMTAAGGSIRDIVKVNVLLTRETDIPEMNRLYAHAFGPTPFPARTTSVVAALPHPRMLLELEATAVIQLTGARG